MGRRVFSSDINRYAEILTKGKLTAPANCQLALAAAERRLLEAADSLEPDLRTVPVWVRSFFHPKTLKEVISFLTVCKSRRDYFLIACLLGILHHQRPGFLSYPSSHLVPYLRSRKFPRNKFPEMYEYRPIWPRLKAKIERAYKESTGVPESSLWTFRRGSVCNITFPARFDCLITSPPYMNALDYVRDNRLRLWFIDASCTRNATDGGTATRKKFLLAVSSVAKLLDSRLKREGFAVLVVGEQVARTYQEHPSNKVCEIFERDAPKLKLCQTIVDAVPDVRRSRRNCMSTKREHILVFRKTN